MNNVTINVACSSVMLPNAKDSLTVRSNGEIRIAGILSEQTEHTGPGSSTLSVLVYLIDSSFLTTVSTVDAPRFVKSLTIIATEALESVTIISVSEQGNNSDQIK